MIIRTVTALCDGPAHDGQEGGCIGRVPIPPENNQPHQYLAGAGWVTVIEDGVEKTYCPLHQIQAPPTTS